MLRERTSDAKGNGCHGNSDGTAVDVADTPRTDSIFLDDSQAPHVVSGDEVETVVRRWWPKKATSFKAWKVSVAPKPVADASA